MSEHWFLLADKYTACLQSDSDLALDQLSVLLLQAYLPGATMLSVLLDRPDILIRHHESAHEELRIYKNEIHVSGAWGGQLPLDAYFLLYGALRLRLIEDGLFPVHGVCVGDDRGYTLIVGHSGAGKTALSLALLRAGGMRLFSGNKTVVSFSEEGGLWAVAGTRTTTIKAVDKSRYANLIGEGLEYGNRFAFFLDDAYQSSALRVPIRQIAIARLNDGVEERTLLSPMSALHNLYPFFLDKVNEDILLGSGLGLLDGSVPVHIKRWLMERLQRMLGKMPVYSLAGSLDFHIASLTLL